MAEILHQFIGSLSHYLLSIIYMVSYIPGGDRQISAINNMSGNVKWMSLFLGWVLSITLRAYE